jgi:hypothetical protein
MHGEFLAGLEDNSDDSDLVIVEQHLAILRRDFHHVLSPKRRGKKHGEAY